jgi:hypothetical protein
MSLTALTRHFPVTSQAVTKPLCVMEEVGVVRNARHGRESLWQVSEAGLEDARRCLELISELWGHALDRLQRFVEEERY